MFSTKHKQFRRIYCLLSAVCASGILLYASYVYKEQDSNLNEGDQANHLPSYSLLISSENDCIEICSSKVCVLASERILENLDDSVDPCEDSYSMSCGNFQRYTPDHDLQDASVNSLMTEEMLLRITGVLENIQDPPTAPAAKLKTIYESCMNADSSEYSAISSVKSYLEMMGMKGWPNLPKDFRFSDPSLEEALTMFELYTSVFFDIRPPRTHEQVKYPGKSMLEYRLIYNQANRVVLSNATLRQDEEAALMIMEISKLEESVDVYDSFSIKVLNYFGVNNLGITEILQDYKNVKETLQVLKEQDGTTIAFQNSNGTRKEDENLQMRRMNCTTDIEQDLAYICDILKHFVAYNKLENIYSDVRVELSDIPYFKKLHLVLSSLSHRSLANFLALRFVQKHCIHLDVFFRITSLHPIFHKWKHCIRVAKEYFPELTRLEYAKKVFKKDFGEIRKIIDFYIGIMAYALKEEEWIGENVRTNLSIWIQNHMDKLNDNMDVLENSPTTENFYKQFVPTKDNMLKNILEHKRYRNRQNFVQPYILERGDVFSLFIQDPFMVNAFNLRSLMLEVLFGLVVPPVFDTGLPQLMNFAVLGDFVGHEISHEFHAFFGEGDIIYTPLMLDNKTRENFRRKAKCLEDQYSEMEIPELKIKVDGVLTMGENLADVMGLQLTQKMIEIFLKEQGETAKFALPALKYNYEQLMILGVDQFWCEKSTKKEMEELVKIDVHAPKSIRVLGKAMNNVKYAEAFQCETGRKMNPAHKCRILDAI